MNMKQLKIWLSKILNIQIILGEENPRADLKIIYVVRLMDALLVWGPALIFVALVMFYEIYR